MEELPDTLLLPGTRVETNLNRTNTYCESFNKTFSSVVGRAQQSTNLFLPYTLSKHQRKGRSIPTDVEYSHLREQRCSVPGSSCRIVDFCILTSLLLYILFILLYYILFYERTIQKSYLCVLISLCRPSVHLLGDFRPSVHQNKVCGIEIKPNVKRCRQLKLWDTADRVTGQQKAPYTNM